MSGKVRIAPEGINATLAGSNDDIDAYLNWITQTEPFADLTSLESGEPLLLTSTDSPRYQFFKPSTGCPHVFNELSIKLVDEICPLGQTSVQLTKLQEANHAHGKLSPEQFHETLSKNKDIVLLDTRNYYESKIGHFDGAIQPAIRKFSQFPEYIERNKDAMRGKTILTYCTGGIRCEKATAYMRQALPDETIFMLDGGIHNYMEWWKHSSDKNGQDPLWQGKNYVFDARQSLALDDRVVSRCQACGVAWDQYSKCASIGCHLLVLFCANCTFDRVYCCTDCQRGEQSNGLCACEQERRKKELERLQI
jgi:predicted sulfurtransferase